MNVIKRLFSIKKKFVQGSKDETVVSYEKPFIFTFYGHDAELHDRIQGTQGNFAVKYEMVHHCIKTQKPFRLRVGISRYNFYCLPAIVQFCYSLYGYTGTHTEPFQLFPVENVAVRFEAHVSLLRKQLSQQDIVSLEDYDMHMGDLLRDLQVKVNAEPSRARDYIRLFSVVCERTFIGPATIVMDPFHRCNTNCRHCWVHTPTLTQPDEFLNRKLDYDLFKGIVDDAAELKSDLIILQGDGEPLMYKHTMDMLRYIRAKGIEAMFFTNGSLLTEERAREIIEMDVKEIYCSLPAGTAETYGRVCPQHKNDSFFDTIKANMKAFMRLRKKMGKERPRLVMTHVMHNENYQDLLAMARLDGEIGADAVRYYMIRLDSMNRDLQLTDQQVQAMNRDLPLAERMMKEKGIHFIDNFKFQVEHYDTKTGAWCEDVFLKQGCTIGWYFCLIPALTDLSLCCHLRTIGWLNKKRFKELWLSPEYERYRRQAKYLWANKEVTFMNGVKLYDEHCTHCDNHQTLIHTMKSLKQLGWDAYVD